MQYRKYRLTFSDFTRLVATCPFRPLERDKAGDWNGRRRLGFVAPDAIQALDPSESGPVAPAFLYATTPYHLAVIRHDSVTPDKRRVDLRLAEIVQDLCRDDVPLGKRTLNEAKARAEAEIRATTPSKPRFFVLVHDGLATVRAFGLDSPTVEWFEEQAFWMADSDEQEDARIAAREPGIVESYMRLVTTADELVAGLVGATKFKTAVAGVEVELDSDRLRGMDTLDRMKLGAALLQRFMTVLVARRFGIVEASTHAEAWTASVPAHCTLDTAGIDEADDGRVTIRNEWPGEFERLGELGAFKVMTGRITLVTPTPERDAPEGKDEEPVEDEVQSTVTVEVAANGLLKLVGGQYRLVPGRVSETALAQANFVAVSCQYVEQRLVELLRDEPDVGVVVGEPTTSWGFKP